MSELPSISDEPVTLEWLEELCHDSDCTVATRDGRFFVSVGSAIEIRCRNDLFALLALLRTNEQPAATEQRQP